MDINGDMYMTMPQKDFAALPENQRIALELIYFGRPWVKNPLDRLRAKQAKETLRGKMGANKWKIFKSLFESLGDGSASQFAFIELTSNGVVDSHGELPNDLI